MGIFRFDDLGLCISTWRRLIVLFFFKLLTAAFLLFPVKSYCVTEKEMIDHLRVADLSLVKRVAKSLADVMAKNAPQRIDSETMLVGAMFIQDPPVVAVNLMGASDISQRELEEGAKYLVCANKLASVLMSRGVKFKYNYRLPSGLVRVDLDTASCNK